MADIQSAIPALAKALEKRGYTKLTPVQQEVLAPELESADMLVSAQTGSGKTVAFGMAVAPTLLEGADRFDRARAPMMLAIAPTRELALQVKRELEWLYEFTGAKVSSCVGGMDIRTERSALNRGTQIVVGTPGRLRDHIERGSLDLSQIKAVVLDEADEMLDLGFRDDLEYILGASPKERRTLMFSATVPRSISSLAKRFQRDAIRVITKAEDKQHLDIEYRALVSAPNDKENAIVNILRYYESPGAIVFCATRATVNHMTSRFSNRGFSVVALSGELSQSERTHALQAMRDGRARVCVATDVAARGIDLPNLELVIHADLPKNSEGLLHRSGRTGRAGRKGTSVLIVPHNARRKAERLLQHASINAVWAKPPSADDVRKRDDERILADPMLVEPVEEAEKEFAAQILAKYEPEQIAAAFIRKYRSDQSAPEELLDNAPVERERKERHVVSNGMWFSISVGRQHSAEPRWLLPLICRAGHLTKRDIGSIKIHQNETHFEIAPKSVEGFLEAIGPGMKLEKSIALKQLGTNPGAPSDGGGQSESEIRDTKRALFNKNRGGERKRARNSERSERSEKPERSERKDSWSKPDYNSDKKSDRKLGKKHKSPHSYDEIVDTPPSEEFLAGKKEKKSKHKKANRSKFAKTDGSHSKTKNSGTGAPPKRKKPKKPHRGQGGSAPRSRPDN
ncbi:MAG: DEAD/DEAH box helicase [Rhizobiaceae bacterium]